MFSHALGASGGVYESSRLGSRLEGPDDLHRDALIFLSGPSERVAAAVATGSIPRHV